jgi:hypothetical protein
VDLNPIGFKSGRVKHFKGKTTSSLVSFGKTESTPSLKGGELKRQENIITILILI